MRLTPEIAAALGLDNVEALFDNRQRSVGGQGHEHAYHLQQEAIIEKIADRAERLTRAEETIRRWFGLELDEVVEAGNPNEAIARLRAAIPELTQLGSVPKRPKPAAPIEDQDGGADPAALMAQMARILNGPGSGRP